MFKSNQRCIHLFLAASAMSLSLAAAMPARASDPEPNDTVALPPNINLLLYYNIFNGTGTVTTASGEDLNHTRIATNINVLRLIHTVDIAGYTVGAEVELPYAAFLGGQKIGGVGAAHQSGFGQPDLNLFFWPVNNPKTGTYVVLSGWFAPPISSFSKIHDLSIPTLTPANNLMNETIEVGAATTIFGEQSKPNLSVQGWYDGYFYQDNPNYASTYLPTPVGPIGPVDATLREQPTQEFRFYLTYNFAPRIAGFGSIGFLQSFGGKQTLRLAGVPDAVDTGSRTNESQFRFFLSSFISPTIQTSLLFYYDIAAHGGPEQRFVGLRLAKFF